MWPIKTHIIYSFLGNEKVVYLKSDVYAGGSFARLYTSSTKHGILNFINLYKVEKIICQTTEKVSIKSLYVFLPYFAFTFVQAMKK